jgi:ABC-type phosphate transport system substrate-binding protein
MKRLLLIATALFGLALSVHAQDAVFITNTASADASLSGDDVKAILLGNKTKWDGGGVIKLVVLTEGAVHDKVIRDHTQRSADQFDKYWKKLVFTGKGMPPASAKTDADVIDYVSKTPGSFGYIAKESAADKVKVIAIK